MDPIQSLQWRYATKLFDQNKKLSDEQISQLTESLRLAPSSFGLQPWKFIVITNPELRVKIRGQSFDQAQVTDASHLIVLCAKEELSYQDVDNYIDNAIKQGGNQERLDNYRSRLKASIDRLNNQGNIVSYTSNQACIALGCLITTCSILKIDSCPMGGFDPIGVAHVLNLQGWKPVVLCPVGYRDNEDVMAHTPKVRYSAEQIIEYIK